MRTALASWIRASALGLSLTALLGCSSAERRVVYVPATMEVSGVDPTAPPRTVSINFLFFQLENLIVLDRHPEVRLRVWACDEHFATEAAPWEPEVGWPAQRFVLAPGCSTSSKVVVGLENATNGHYLAVEQMSLSEMLNTKPLALNGAGGKIFLDVRSYFLPSVEQPRQVPVSVPAARPLDELATSKKQPVDGWRAVPVAAGDSIQITVNGEVCESDGACFGPEGARAFFGLLRDHRLYARIGDQERRLSRQASFVAERTGDLLLFVEGAGPSLSGTYDVVVDINPKLDSPAPNAKSHEDVGSTGSRRTKL